ncbi:hypothetical protein Ppha_1856 [Pelodictyon phaeoclathratiforme BU-1]|uniref:Uncharacterized protein n=1 Tax=Pelodictyon phaeoclathratiforme (strain DSM 5477 / BU-1) TaxID=324925 RepID=B4SBX6_PELPB|nr:hypothetical protein Ppha_1856 [Pelodictyon phaeoclathratiforme BU-1]
MLSKHETYRERPRLEQNKKENNQKKVTYAPPEMRLKRLGRAVNYLTNL